MNKNILTALDVEQVKDLKTETALNQPSRMLTKLTLDKELIAEVTNYLGHETIAP